MTCARRNDVMLLSVGFGLKASKSDALHISSHPFTTKNSVYVKSKKMRKVMIVRCANIGKYDVL